MESNRIVPLVLAGGAGTRLWPVSRSSKPKQFIDLVGRHSTFQSALQRFSDRSLFAPPIVITNAAFRSITQKQAQDVGIDISVVLEPERRDSCAAILAGALVAASKYGPQTPVIAVPADHMVLDDDLFVAATQQGLRAACDGSIVTFGIAPTAPKTAYGYIRPGDEVGGGVYRVAEFVEKPNAETAARYISEGMLWNGGYFQARADVLGDEVRRFEPDIHKAVVNSLASARVEGNATLLDANEFGRAPARSIDYAVMERTNLAAVLKGTFRWSDIGSWDAVLEASTSDANGNVTVGPVEMLDTGNSFVRSEGRLTTVLGMTDVVVVSTQDAVLVASRDAAQRVRDLVQVLEHKHPPIISEHPQSHRPWGWYQDIDRGDRFRVKRIVVAPGGRLSLQKHHHRAEHWVVVRGTAEVTINETVQTIWENQSIYIPLGQVHRLANPGKIPLELIEVQTGSYLEEDDIVRIEDIYHRV